MVKRGLLVPPRNPEAILHLLEHPAERVALGKNARQVARERYDPEQVATETLKAYREILDSSGSPAGI